MVIEENALSRGGIRHGAATGDVGSLIGRWDRRTTSNILLAT